MSASTSENLDETWYVKLPNGDVHRVTLDQLDGAFQGGRIDGSAMVMPGNPDQGTSWTSLSQLLGLEDEGPAPQAAVAPQPVYTPAPIAARAPLPASIPTVSAMAAAPRAYASVTPAAAPRVYASVTPPPVAYGQVQAPVSNSLRPMSFDLGKDELEDMPFKRSSRKGWVVGLLGLAAAAGVAGFVSTQRHTGGGDDIATVAAAAAMAVPQSYAAAPLPLPPSQPTPYVTPTPAPAQGSAPSEASPMNPQFTDRFNEGTKQKLLAADQAREDKAKARHGAAGAYRPSHSSKSSTVFTSGGNKYDPLNSNL